MRTENILERINELIQEGVEIQKDDEYPSDIREFISLNTQKQPDSLYERYVTWLTSSKNILRFTFGESTDHYKDLKEHTNKDSNLLQLPYCLGIMKGAKKDLEDGFLSSMRDITRADAFKDLLGQAEYLLGKGFTIPAAVLAGVVLEDTLRRLCERFECMPEKPLSISKLNDALYKARENKQLEEYDNTFQKQIIAWGGLRNKVAHHNFREPIEINPNDVRRMIGGISDFIAQHFTK